MNLMEKLAELHNHYHVVHGDIRLEAILHNNGHGSIIDFDFVG